ncbi:MAG TPA: 4-hydroxy-tetrahydrodipicolinate synthase [Clostridiales bacterium]|nr:4-hydroxy-tetrahydrodipicolinate synthase [Clostridiales bacterium]HOJ36197.1 4-hydroxy-tetrahydrodipicolinate synthase [Clostridiales bacterium]HPP68948.1 4-hydroxy-tetrahydrodipicolinate synthase [Clostridiales bacterium]HQD72782.1 4-hydroxy-tetrahydrodipicolinate synthase [Clostridiales bacterium]
MKDLLFTGSGVAIVTPFTEDGREIDFPMLEKLINFQIENHTDAIIICGTTGEGSTLTHEEHAAAIDFAVKVVAGRVPVIAGTGSNDTEYAVKLSNEAERSGVDGLLMVTPYYNKTSQDGLIEHYNYIADRVSTPIILYNVPSRTGLDIKPSTYLELSKHKRIVAAKEANGNISAIAQTAALCGDNLHIYSGNDDQILAIMAHGGKGVISVLANVVPKAAHDIAAAYLEGDVERSRKLQFEYLDLCNDLFIDVNPIPVKEALNMMGFKVGPCRRPLAPLSKANREKLAATLKKHNLIW